MTVVLLLVTLFSCLQFYSPPFMIPSATSIYEDIDSSEPLLYRGQVNSIYQRDMITFTTNYVEGRIASDAITRNQMIGFSSRDYFNRYVTWYYPLLKEINPNINEKEFQYLQIHYPGISGDFEERADIRDLETIVSLVTSDDYSVIYSNSQSFVLQKVRYR